MQSMPVINESKPSNNTQEELLSQWIKSQLFYQEQDRPKKDGLSPEQADAIITIRKRISSRS